MSVGNINTDPLERPAGAGRGRPRSPRCDEAILDAAWALLEQLGYSRLSMERIAAEAGVGKPTLYLRYPDKAHVVAAAFVRHRVGAAPRPIGDLRADIAAQLDHIRIVMDGAGMSLLGTCLIEEEHLPDLIALLREQSVRPGRRIIGDLLDAAVRRGELHGGVDTGTAVDMAVGAYYAHRIGGDPFDQEWAGRVSGAILGMMGAPRS
jgi:AcrR family transcriptional regulator